MATRKAHEGAVRWARGAVIALFSALAVLVHHESAAITVSSVQSAPHAGHAMPGMTSASSATAMPTGFAADHAHLPDVHAPAHGSSDSACATLGIQHCTTASIDSAKLAVPSPVHAEQLPSPYQAVTSTMPARTIGRAPPDLSVLSQLRI
ncbi:hypothetical protein [Streptomyces sp. TRM68367]|uniref:hypothetical protein n=1 Tax=Streptomyces sp. TRM68367 TaxID=2758415 RepID=UPI00165AE863|nr:hypothetical protein [Streptomyces sp. TRM68367]MBC9725028.1 hypothetical protein [Streptomyces sp. TRM68367]